MAKAATKNQTIEDIEKEERALEAQLAKAKERAKELLSKRRAELQAQLSEAKATYENTESAITAELKTIDDKLGIAAVPPQKIHLKTYNGVGNSKPKDVLMTDAEWHKIVAVPLNMKLKSLDNHILLALHNMGEEELHTKTIAAACLAMGHETKSDNFQPTVASTLNRLKGEGCVASGSRGHYLITKKGKKKIEDMIDQIQASTNDVESLLIKALTKAKIPIHSDKLVSGMMACGYTPKDTSTARSETTAAIESLKVKNKIITKRENNATIVSLA